MKLAYLAILAALVATPALAQAPPHRPAAEQLLAAQAMTQLSAHLDTLAALGDLRDQITTLQTQLAQAKQDLAKAKTQPKPAPRKP